ncbi:rhodanese-like domain-containing protein [Chloroflexota bacterium]
MNFKRYTSLFFMILLVSGLILTAGCSSGVIETPVEEEIESPSLVIKDISAQDAFSLIGENSDNPDFVIIDVRTPEEYDEGHVEDADNIDFYAPDFSERLNSLDKSKTYLIYCRSGNRSGQALAIIKEMDFLKIYHMDGGMLEWTAEELPTVK